MIDKLIAVLALATYIATLAIIAIYVPEPDLVIVLLLGVGFASYDFFLSIFRSRNGRNGRD